MKTISKEIIPYCEVLRLQRLPHKHVFDMQNSRRLLYFNLETKGKFVISVPFTNNASAVIHSGKTQVDRIAIPNESLTITSVRRAAEVKQRERAKTKG